MGKICICIESVYYQTWGYLKVSVLYTVDYAYVTM